MLLKVTVCLFSRTCCLVICIQAGSRAGMEQSTQCPGQVYFCLCRFMVFSMTLAWYVENERDTEGWSLGQICMPCFVGSKKGVWVILICLVVCPSCTTHQTNQGTEVWNLILLVSYNLASVSCIHPKELIINLNSSLFLILNTAVFSFTAIL
jgi:hypothetical protein